MKFIFAIWGSLLAVAGAATWLSMPDTRSDVPVLYWVTDNNPARIEQVRRFHDWLARQPGAPQFELRLDTSNTESAKKIIQGVSGVAADIIDLAGFDLAYFQAIGLLDDVTDDAARMGFDPSHTYPAVGPQITLNDRQYLFPCNVWGNLYFVNRATFGEYRQQPPPRRWPFEEFEQRGRQFVAAANAERRSPATRVFFADSVDRQSMRHSLGLSLFNETLVAAQRLVTASCSRAFRYSSMNLVGGQRLRRAGSVRGL